MFHGLWTASPLIVPMVMGLVVAILIPSALRNPIGFAWVALSLYGLGLGLFLVAKLSLVRQGILMSVGSARMSP